MMDEKTLHGAGGVTKKYSKGDFIFHEDDLPRFYYQIIEGGVKMFNLNMNGKEFTQGVFKAGESFGEPPLFINEKYPATAMATCDTEIIKVSREHFMKLLDQYPDMQREILILMAQRIYNKSVQSKEIINNTPEVRILSLLNTYKKRNNNEHQKMQIPLTRQDIANFTGLRVETVIRTLSKMRDNHKVEIINRKLVY